MHTYANNNLVSALFASAEKYKNNNNDNLKLMVAQKFAKACGSCLENFNWFKQQKLTERLHMLAYDCTKCMELCNETKITLR